MRAMKQDGVMRAWRTWLLAMYNYDLSLKDLSISQHELRHKTRCYQQGLRIVSGVVEQKLMASCGKAWKNFRAYTRQVSLVSNKCCCFGEAIGRLPLLDVSSFDIS